MHARAETSSSNRCRVERVPRLLLVAACLMPAPFAAATQSTAPATMADPVKAVWQPRQLSFTYDSTTSIYACQALADRVKSILRAVGARDDLKVRASNCSETMLPMNAHPYERASLGATQTLPNRTVDRNYGPRQTATVNMKLMMPTEVTPEILAELDKDKSRRELLSRVTANPATRYDDPVAFPATVQRVTLSRKSIGVEPEECELLDQVSRVVLPQLGMRVVRRNMDCSPGRVSSIPPEIEVEALMVAPMHATSTPLDPAAPMKKDEDVAPADPTGDADEPVNDDPQK